MVPRLWGNEGACHEAWREDDLLKSAQRVSDLPEYGAEVKAEIPLQGQVDGGVEEGNCKPRRVHIDRAELEELCRAFLRDRQIVKGEHMLF